MEHRSPINNIAHSLMNPDIHTIYSPDKSSLDAIMYDLDIYTHLISTDNYYYDLYISNNFLEHSEKTKKICDVLHIKDLVFFDSPPPTKFKKEDIALLNTVLANTHKVFLTKNIANSWTGIAMDHKCHSINYGVPINESSMHKTKVKNVLIINTEKNNQLAVLHQHIQQHIPHTDIITDIPLNLDTWYNILSDYRIIIDINKVINVLCSLANGCQVITSATDLDVNLKGIHTPNDYSKILTYLDEILSTDTDFDLLTNNKSILETSYSYPLFATKIKDLFMHIKTKEIYQI